MGDDTPSDRGSEDFSSSLPPAPLPPHERSWRHPSELGSAAVHITESRPSVDVVGRGVVGASILLGMCLVLGLVVLARPSAGGSDAATVIRLTSADLAYVRFDERNADGQAMAVGVGDSKVLITTKSAVGDSSSVEADMGDGNVASLQVMDGDPASPIAVLIADGSTASDPAPLVGAPVAIGQDVVVLAANPLRAQVERIVSNLALLSVPEQLDVAAIIEGTPVVDRSGHLVGICTHVDDRLAIVLTAAIGDALDGAFTND